MVRSCLRLPSTGPCFCGVSRLLYTSSSFGVKPNGDRFRLVVEEHAGMLVAAAAGTQLWMEPEVWFVSQMQSQLGLHGGSSCISVSSVIVGTLAGVDPPPDGVSTGVTRSMERVLVVGRAALQK